VVGAQSDGVQALTMRFDGVGWTIVGAPSPGSAAYIGVSCTSTIACWAVGSTGSQTLIAKYNGTAWKRIKSPNP
jgi:hypothetical protein